MPLITNVMGSTGEELSRAGRGRRRRATRSRRSSSTSPARTSTTGLDIGADPGRARARCWRRVRPRTRQAADRQADAEHGRRRRRARRPPRPRGADAVSLINTLRAHGARTRGAGEPWLGGGTGGLSGPAIRPVALAQVARGRGARVASRSSGMGGVQSGRARARSARRRRDAGRRGHRELPRPAARGADRRELREIAANCANPVGLNGRARRYSACKSPCKRG